MPDLLGTAAVKSEGFPAWLAERPAPAWFVVRRAVVADGVVPIGVRGWSRAQRWAGVLPFSDISERLSPAAVSRRPAPERADLAAMRILRLVAPRLDDVFPGAWGPGGSIGFELATGAPVVRSDSDLDVVVAAPVPLTPLQRESLIAARRLAQTSPTRIDVQVETPAGGIALDEWLRSGGHRRVAVRTAAGPRLLHDPWAPS